MDDQYLKNVVEAALLAAGRPLTLDELLELFEERVRPEGDDLRKAVESLQAEYEGRGIELREVASGFRIQIRGTVSEHVSRLWQERPGKYSRALLETLALVAYRQPITRGEIEEIRGVGINQNILRTLFERNWIRVVGHREVPGHPELLGTTREFLDYFGLKSLEDLPTLAALRDMDNVGVQLELPGAPVEQTAAVAGEGTEAAAVDSDAQAQVVADDDAADEELSAASEGGDEEGTEDEEGDVETVKAQGLVARGQDD